MTRHAIAIAVCLAALRVVHAQSTEATPTSTADPAGWRHVALGQALDTAESITDPYRRAEVLTSIARAQALIDDTRAADRTIRSALTTAQQISEPTFQGWVLNDIVLAQLQADDLIGAKQTADRIGPVRPQSAALAAVATVQVRGGNLTAAQATATRIRDERVAGEVWRQIVVAQLADGAREAARQTLRHIDDGFYQAVASGDVATVDVRSGNIDRANTLAAKVAKKHRAQVYGRIVLARVDLGDVRGALDTLGKIDDELYRALVQGRIAAVRAATGESAEAQQLFAAASNSMQAVRDRDHRKASMLSQLARIQVASGDEAGARESLRRAMAATSAMPSDQRRDDALEVIARTQARIGDSEAALNTALQIKDRVSQALLIRDVVALQKEVNAATAVVRSSAVVQNALTETAALFGVIGVQLLRKDQSAGVDRTIDAARTAVLSVDDPQMRPGALAALAAARVTIGDTAGGASIFQESMTFAGALERPDQRAAAYVRIVNALDERLLFLGQPARKEAEREL